jgi:hypothetical protein
MPEINSEVEAENKLSGNLAFVKEVAKYFMDFLETDFHKRKTPKRSIKLRNSDNLLVGLNLAKYPVFEKEIYNLVAHSFIQEKTTKISKGVYRTNLPKNLLDLVKLQVERIKSAQVNEVVSQIAEGIENAAMLYQKEHNKALSASLETATSSVKNGLVLPFVSNIEKPIENLAIGDENDIYLIEEELSEILMKLLESKISEVVNKFIAGEKQNIPKSLNAVFDLEDVKNGISNYFESLQVGDLFGEIFDIGRNKAILDKQEFYLYFCDITFSKIKGLA